MTQPREKTFGKTFESARVRTPRRRDLVGIDHHFLRSAWMQHVGGDATRLILGILQSVRSDATELVPPPILRHGSETNNPLRMPVVSGVGRTSGGNGFPKNLSPHYLSPGASKPATYGRFKTGHDSWGFLVHDLTVSGSSFCSKHQTSTGFLFRILSRISGRKTRCSIGDSSVVQSKIDLLGDLRLSDMESMPGSHSFPRMNSRVPSRLRHRLALILPGRGDGEGGREDPPVEPEPSRYPHFGPTNRDAFLWSIRPTLLQSSCVHPNWLN